MRYLVLDRHPAYTGLLTAVGGSWDVVPLGRRADEPWLRAAALHDRASLIAPAEARARHAAGRYDAVVCQAPSDIDMFTGSDAPLLLSLHATAAMYDAFGDGASRVRRTIAAHGARVTTVCTSTFIRDSWGIATPEPRVIPPGVVPGEYGPHRGHLGGILAVGNLRSEFADLTGFDLIERACAGLPVSLAGWNPGIPGGRELLRASERRACAASHQVFLAVARAPFDDPCSVPFVEAMATGMPIVALAHPALPVTHGVSALIADAADGLRSHLITLLEDRALGARLGAAARRVASERFGHATFASAWRAALERPSSRLASSSDLRAAAAHSCA